MYDLFGGSERHTYIHTYIHTYTHTYIHTYIHTVMRSLSLDAAKMLAKAFISSRLDYCNSTLYGITDSFFRRLQAVQNATARLITGVQRKDDITPILRQLHWLPVRERVIFKNALLVFKALPPYLADDCQLLADTGRRQLRSSDVVTCSVLRTHSSLGDRCFAVARPRTCNSLPIKLRQPDLSLEQFRRLLKTHLFS